MVVEGCTPFYIKPECEIILFKNDSEVMQSSIENWGEEDLFEDE